MNIQRPALKISYDLLSLSTEIQGIEIPDTIWSQLYVLLSAGSDNIDQKSKSVLKLPLFEFRRILKPLANFINKENIRVYYDIQSKEFINNHIQDLKALNNHIKEKPKLDNNETKKKLLNTAFTRNLTNEQLRDTTKLIYLRHGANFSVPGAGKTSTLLAIYSILKSNKIVNKLLVIAPRNAFISWEEEFNSCFKETHLKITRLTGGRARISGLLKKNPEISLITYHQLPNVLEEVSAYLHRNQVQLVLDESHRIKRGIPGVHFSAAIKLADLAKRRDILSGTPMPQSPLDLEPQFDFLWPGGDLFTEIRLWSDDQEKIKIANQTVKPLYVRTTKNELGLKNPIVKITSIELGAVQNELYQLIRSETARILSGIDRNDLIAFRKLGRHVVRLLQIASNPMLITSSDDYFDESLPVEPGTGKWELLIEFSKYEKPAKIEYTVRQVRNLANQGKKVIVWSSFIRNIELLEKLLLDLGPVSIYGLIETGDEKESDTREGRIRRFHEDSDCKVMIANPAACGEGISLHKICHNAIYTERTFNAAHFLQSIDRIHRLGLSPDVDTKIEIVLAKNTIDEVVQNRLGKKILAMSKVLDDIDLNAFAYDPEDIIEEIPGGIDKSDLIEIIKHLK